MPLSNRKRHLKAISKKAAEKRRRERLSGAVLAADARVATPAAATIKKPPSCAPVQSQPSSSLKKRMKLLEDVNAPSVGEYDGKVVLSVSQLQILLSGIQCVALNCKGTVAISLKTVNAASDMSLICTKCSAVQEIINAPRKEGFCETNLIFVYNSLVDGGDQANLNELLRYVGNPFTADRYMQHCRFLYEKMKTFYCEKMHHCRERVRQYYIDRGAEPDEDGAVAIDVSCQGTLMKRGRKSRIGAAFVMEVETGMVIDVEVLCNYCSSCNKRVAHDRCSKNFDGQSEAMEAECAVRMFSRSCSYKLLFQTIVGDGDSSAFKAVSELNDGLGPYRTPVVKEASVDHVAKRLGTRLRRMKEKRAIMRECPVLTDAAIENLSSYFGKAIRDNIGTDYETMKKAVWSSYFHLTSSDAKPEHHFCPKGENSRCFYNRANAKRDAPEPHCSENLFLSEIPYEERQHILAVYSDLTSPTLLQHCLTGATRNKNKIIHQKLWSMCHKRNSRDLARATFAAQVTSVEHNFGHHQNLLTHLFGSSDVIQTKALQDDAETERLYGEKESKELGLLMSPTFQLGATKHGDKEGDGAFLKDERSAWSS